MKELLKTNERYLQWMLGAIVIVLAIAVWASVRLKAGSALTLYTLFPVFGLIAYSVMWTHYINGALKGYAGLADRGKDAYWYVSSALVLVCILLHPALLSLGLWRDGFGLPPLSYLTVYESMRLAVILGSMSLIIFLAFELHRWFRDRPWWRYIDRLQLAAMIAVFVHALSLGGELNVGWFKVLWWVYGVTLAVAYVYSYKYDKKKGVAYESKIE